MVSETLTCTGGGAGRVMRASSAATSLRRLLNVPCTSTASQ